MNNNFQEAIDKISLYIDKYSKDENIELEFRLGLLIDGGKFDAQVPDELFKKINKLLGSNKNWDCETTESTDFFYNGMRMSVAKNKKKICIKKEKLCTIDFTFEGTPFDLRVCFSRENPIPVSNFKPPSKKDLYTRKKKRNTYKYKYWNYDITEICVIENTVEKNIYEVELDISNLKHTVEKANSKYIVHSGLLKIMDLINICEKIGPDNKLELYDIKSE